MERKSSKRNIIVSDYDPKWHIEFENIKTNLEAEIGDYVLDIIHIGSTAVINLAAKPIIDMVIIGQEADFERLQEGLQKLGYYHSGDQGIPGREVFKLHEEEKSKQFPHHLYYCNTDADVLLEYRAFLTYLRSRPDVVEAYGNIKKVAASLHPHDINSYMDHKGKFIAKHLTKAMNEYIRDNEIIRTDCPSCLSREIIAEFNIKYLSSGMKKKTLQYVCQSCGNTWQKG